MPQAARIPQVFWQKFIKTLIEIDDFRVEFRRVIDGAYVLFEVIHGFEAADRKLAIVFRPINEEALISAAVGVCEKIDDRCMENSNDTFIIDPEDRTESTNQGS